MLLLSLNHAGLMSASGPQQAYLNGLLIPCVAITLYLASVVLLKQSVGRAFGADGSRVAIGLALPLSMLLLLLLSLRVWIVRTGALPVWCASGASRASRPATSRPRVAIELDLGALAESSTAPTATPTAPPPC